MSLRICVAAFTFCFVMGSAVRCLAAPGADDSPAATAGQEDLDSAVEAKLGAESPDELTRVIALAQRSLDKGLDEGNAEFARKLLASTLFQRGRLLAEAIFAPPQPDPRWPQLRQLAVGDLERALELEPKQAAPNMLLGRLQSLPGGDRKKALAALEKAVELGGDEPNMQYEALMLHAGMVDTSERRLVDLDKAVELRPKDPVPLRLRGSLKLSQNKAEDALADFDAAIKLDPDNASTYEVRGLALAMLKRLDEASESYGRAVDLSPQSPSLLLQRAQVNFLSEKFAAAVDDATKALAIDPDNVPARLLRAHAEVRAGKSAEALSDVDTLIKKYPDLTPALRTRAVLEAANGKTDEAIRDLERVSQQEPDDLEVQFQLALLYRAKKDFPKAFTIIDAALDRDPGAWFLHFGRGDMLLSVGKHADAIKDYQRALDVHKDDSGLLNNYAWVLATSPDDKVRNGKRAIELATEACELTDYGQPHILSTLAASYAEAGDFDTAIRWSKKAVELASDEATRDNLRKELASYDRRQAWREVLHDDQPGLASEEKKNTPPSGEPSSRAAEAIPAPQPSRR